MTELDIARRIATGEAPSPTPFGGAMLIALRISGTGLAARPALGEQVYRDPKIWLAPEMMARVSGLPVIVDHPAGAMLDDQSFAQRSVGSILHPYAASREGFEDAEAGVDLWGIARVFLDAESLAEIASGSTSPSVAFSRDSGNQTIRLADGTVCLVEGDAELIDHLALVTVTEGGAGVWDKATSQRGIRIDTKRNTEMADEHKPEDEKKEGRKDAEFPGQTLDKMLSTLDSVAKMCDGLSRRMDAYEAMDSARRRKDSEGDPLADMPGEPKRVKADAEAERKEAMEKADAQARADAVYMALGQRADPPMAGETTFNYRRRLARKMQRHSETMREVDLQTINDSVAFGAIEKVIYADALVASRTPEVAPGELREIVKIDATGRRISTFHGESFITQLRTPGRIIRKFNTKFAA